MPRPRSSSTACPKTARGCSGSSNDKREAGSRSGARMGAQRGWEEGGRLPSRRQVLKGKVPVIVSNCGLAEQLPCVAHVLFAHRARRAAHLAALPSRSHEDYPAQDQNFHVSFSKCLPIIKGESPCRQGSSVSAHEGRLRPQLDVFTTTSPRIVAQKTLSVPIWPPCVLVHRFSMCCLPAMYPPSGSKWCEASSSSQSTRVVH